MVSFIGGGTFASPAVDIPEFRLPPIRSMLPAKSGAVTGKKERKILAETDNLLHGNMFCEEAIERGLDTALKPNF